MKMYPQFTEENFEEMCRKYLRRSKGRDQVLKVRKPRNGEEFAALTKACLGVELHLASASAGYYEIAEAYDEYKNLPLIKLWGKKCEAWSSNNYFGAKIALQTTFGKLRTGGTARSQYGSFDVISYRDKLRLGNFIR
jgi:hypothetical protein